LRNFGWKIGREEFERSGSRWDYNIKMNLKEIRCEVLEQINLVQEGVQQRIPVKTVMKLKVPQKAGDVLAS
jgi:hypothetical protein